MFFTYLYQLNIQLIDINCFFSIATAIQNIYISIKEKIIQFLYPSYRNLIGIIHFLAGANSMRILRLDHDVCPVIRDDAQGVLKPLSYNY